MCNLKKLLFVILITAFSFNANSEVVKKIDIQGNERISNETIIIFGDVALGKNYESNDINSLIKKLYETTFFSNISVELSNGKLTILVEENPIINSIIFDGEKAKKYKEKIKEMLSLRENGAYVPNNVKQDINRIKTFYRTLGFYFVNIDVQVENLKKNRVNIVYTLEKGEKAKIAKIFFLGDKKIRDKKLRDIITSQEAKFWKFISGSVYLNKERVDLDKRLLKNYYRNKGYYEVDIQSSNVEYAEGEGFILTFSINAGKRYRFRKVFAEVDKALDQSAFLSLEKDFNSLVGHYYSNRKLTKVLQKIDKLSEQKELQFINHSILETLDENGVEVKINIFEGEKFIIERINIVGNTITNDSVIRSELVVDEGDPFSELLVNRSINNIKGRNIFGKVTYKSNTGSSEDLRVLQINVEEKATGEIMAGAGVGTDGTSFMLAVKENNWLGRGIGLIGDLNLTEDKISGKLEVNNPNYNYTGNAVNAALSVSSTEAPISGYDSSKTGVSLGTSFEQYEDVWFTPKIIATYEDIEVETTASSAIQKMEGSFTNIDLEYGIWLDKRNQVYQPTEGYKTGFEQRLPILQDSSSIINTYDISAYNDLSEDVIGSVKFFIRSIHGVDEDVRLTNRLFLPRHKLRGFNTSKVGPKDGEDYIGGNYTSALSLEAGLPNLLPESYRTDFSLFLDTANVWSVDYSDSIDDSNKIRSAVGIGANVFTTIGPLSFTIAQDISKASTDETETFNFRLGTSF